MGGSSRSLGVVAQFLPGHRVWWTRSRAKSESLAAVGLSLLYDKHMDIATIRGKLPKYIYTPYYQRAFLTISADVYGKWSAGYCVWVDPAPGEPDDSQRCYNYGPYINEAEDIDQAVIQLFQAYLIWKDLENGLHRGRSTSS